MSYTWRSILGAREVIEKGARRVIGNSASINIWKDPWVMTLPNGRVDSGPNGEIECPQMVRELWSDREWNSEMLLSLFSNTEVVAIKRLQVPMYDSEDKWMWKYSKDGEYSVRSAYYMLLNDAKTRQASSSATRANFEWKRIWGANLPPKIKHFAWRAIKGGLAVNMELVKRGIEREERCEVCGENEETVLHALVTCGGAKSIWYLSPLRLEFAGEETNSFSEWCNSLCAKVRDMDWWSIFWSLCWGIWLQRNAWIFNRRKKGMVEVIQKAVALVGEYELAAELGKVPSAKPHHTKKWKAPEEGRYKVNTDAALFPDRGVGLGGVVRDSSGEVVAATCLNVVGEMEVVMAEALAVRHGLKIAMEAGFTNLVLEMDNLSVFSKLKKHSSEATPLGSILSDIHVLASLSHSVCFAFVKREGNGVAHVLARLSCNFEGLRVWLEEYPPEAQAAVMADFSASSD